MAVSGVQGPNTVLAQAIRKNRRDAENKTIRLVRQFKSAREGAQPDNLMDEDVRRYMKGL
ncbi:hypothetical protein D3C84_1218220 [compost metagenome]